MSHCTKPICWAALLFSIIIDHPCVADGRGRSRPQRAWEQLDIYLECPEWSIDLYAGYSDSWWLSVVPAWHCVPDSHEVLSGEWGAAIYYDSIAYGGGDTTALTGAAVWLPDWFILPDWSTNSSFRQIYSLSWDDPSNPSGNGTNDTAKEILTNGQVDIMIDYEIADLGQVFASPLGIMADTSTGAFALSSRYVLLQTYTIKNISEIPLDSMQFYQLLHGHPADEYGPTVTSVYDSDSYPDSILASYLPFNPIHKVDNFHYDITQWNNPAFGGTLSTSGWVDWLGFSSTDQPSAVGNNLYNGHSPGKPPPPGTHWDVEARALNGLTSIGPDEVGGAMMWDIGSLASGDSVSITVALMAGQMDCNGNGQSDLCDIVNGVSEDTNGNGIPDECDGPTGVGEHPIDYDFKLYQNIPNPFNPETFIRYELARPTQVTLGIYDVNGKLIKMLVSGMSGPGMNEIDWDGRDDKGDMVSSGIYFYRLTAGRSQITKKMVLLR